MFRRLSLLIALLLVVVACTSSSDDTTTTGADTSSTTTTNGDAPSTTQGQLTTTTVGSAPTTDPDLSGLEGVSDEIKAQLEELIREAQEIRGLPFLSPPIITVVTDEELERRVRENLEEGAEDIPADEALYKVLGLLADGADFESILFDLYGEQVAGFYDGETGEIVVPAREDGFNLLQQGTMVHELVHALTDQHFDFDSKFQLLIDDDLLDEATAYQALIEGDATFAEVQWVRSLSGQELGEFLALGLDVDTDTLLSAPRFLEETLFFPYDTGMAFVQELYADDGWASINSAYGAMVTLPGSTEQVITPSDYTVDLPVAVEIPEVVIPGYNLERTSVWGEQGFRIMLNQGSTASVTATASDGWAGDSYHQWFDGENAAFLVVFEGDTSADVAELEEALLTFALESVPEENFVWVEQLDGRLYFIAADETSVGELIRATAGLDEVGS